MRPDLFGTVEDQMEVEAEGAVEAGARQAGADAGPAHNIYNPEAAFMSAQSLESSGILANLSLNISTC